MAKSPDRSMDCFKGIDGIRRRPAMYIGGTDARGMFSAVCEAIANSVDQFLMNNAMRSCSWTPAVGLIHVMMKDAQYTGSSITRLNVPKFRSIIADRLSEKLQQFCTEFSVGSSWRGTVEAQNWAKAGRTQNVAITLRRDEQRIAEV